MSNGNYPFYVYILTNLNNKMEKKNYVEPTIEIIEVQIEKGFAASGEDPIVNDSIGW